MLLYILKVFDFISVVPKITYLLSYGKVSFIVYSFSCCHDLTWLVLQWPKTLRWLKFKGKQNLLLMLFCTEKAPDVTVFYSRMIVFLIGPL